MRTKKNGFSLIEVVLAIGIFLVTILALVGLLGPTLSSVNEVENSDEVVSVVNTVNAFLQNSPAIASGGESKFDTIFNEMASDDENQLTLFVFRSYISDTNDNIIVKVGFRDDVSVGDPANASVTAADFNNAAGPIYRVILTPSSVIPISGTAFDGTSDQPYRSAGRGDDTKVYSLIPGDVSGYFEGYFAMEVRIFAEAPGPAFSADVGRLADFAEVEPLFTYNTAIVR